MKKLGAILSILAGITALFSGCKNMPNDGIPFYLQIDSVSVLGHNNKITDVWVEANTDNLGAYEIPISFPVLLQNEVRFVLSAGIWESGQAGVRVLYPFYEVDTFVLNAVPGEKYNHVPEFKYRSGTQFRMDENFNVGNPFSGMVTVTDDAEHSFCGNITVDAVDSNKMAVSLTAWDLPEGNEIWMEIDYKCDVPFYIGLFGGDTSSTLLQYPIMFVTPHTAWNKLYVKLSSAVGNIRAPTYRIYFEALRPVGVAAGYVNLDNIKLVHF